MFSQRYLFRLFLIFGGLIIAFVGVYKITLFIQIVGILLMILGGLLIREHFFFLDFLVTGSLFIFLIGFNKVASRVLQLPIGCGLPDPINRDFGYGHYLY